MQLGFYGAKCDEDGQRAEADFAVIARGTYYSLKLLALFPPGLRGSLVQQGVVRHFLVVFRSDGTIQFIQ
jgi:hypothetical protein